MRRQHVAVFPPWLVPSSLPQNLSFVDREGMDALAEHDVDGTLQPTSSMASTLTSLTQDSDTADDFAFASEILGMTLPLDSTPSSPGFPVVSGLARHGMPVHRNSPRGVVPVHRNSPRGVVRGSPRESVRTGATSGWAPHSPSSRK